MATWTPCHCAYAEPMQLGRAALSAEELNAALYWFELVRTWAPSSLQAEVERCKAAGAVPFLPVRSAELHSLRQSRNNTATC